MGEFLARWCRACAACALLRMRQFNSLRADVEVGTFSVYLDLCFLRLDGDGVLTRGIRGWAIWFWQVLDEWSSRVRREVPGGTKCAS